MTMHAPSYLNIAIALQEMKKPGYVIAYSQNRRAKLTSNLRSSSTPVLAGFAMQAYIVYTSAQRRLSQTSYIIRLYVCLIGTTLTLAHSASTLSSHPFERDLCRWKCNTLLTLPCPPPSPVQKPFKLSDYSVLASTESCWNASSAKIDVERWLG